MSWTFWDLVNRLANKLIVSIDLFNIFSIVIFEFLIKIKITLKKLLFIFSVREYINQIDFHPDINKISSYNELIKKKEVLLPFVSVASAIVSSISLLSSPLFSLSLCIARRKERTCHTYINISKERERKSKISLRKWTHLATTRREESRRDYRRDTYMHTHWEIIPCSSFSFCWYMYIASSATTKNQSKLNHYSCRLYINNRQ